MAKTEAHFYTMKNLSRQVDQAPECSGSTAPKPTIYISATAMATIKSLAGLTECDRDILNLNKTHPANRREGYYINAESLRLAMMPAAAVIAMHICPVTAATYGTPISFPTELRGVIFAGAPNLPDNYAAILTYWSPLAMTSDYNGAQHCQNQLNQYVVPELNGVTRDALLSNGIVMCIDGLGLHVNQLDTNQYIEVRVPVDFDMLGMDRERFDSDMDYQVDSYQPFERVYLKVGDIQASPNPNFIALTVLHTENFDADFFL